MFNLGNDDKEKLKENMEEIKNLVNNDDTSGDTEQDKPDFSQMNQEAAQNQTDQGPKQQPFTQENTGSLQKQENNSFPRSQSRKGNTQNTSQQNNTQNNSLNNSFSQSQQGERDSVQQNHRSQEPERPDSQNQEETSRELDESEHSTPSADFSSGESNSETIFLTVEHFEEVQERVKEMRYLSNEIEDVMNHLEAGVSEDKHTESEAQQLLNDFSNRRGEIEEIISSNKE